MNQSAYVTSQSELKGIAQLKSVKSLPSQVMIISSGSEFLLLRAKELLKGSFKKMAETSLAHLQGDQLTHETLRNIAEQGTMFDPVTINFVDRAENFDDIKAFLTTLKPRPANPLFFFLKGANKPPSVKGISCLPKILRLMEPAPFEVRTFIGQTAEEFGLKIKRDGVEYLHEALGRDLPLIFNELKKLSFIGNSGGKALGAAEVGEYICFLKADFAFRLRNHILDRQSSRAHALLSDLVSRGESALGILGMLAKHTRHAIALKQAPQKGLSTNEVAKSLGMQTYLVKSYSKYLAQKDPSQLRHSLDLCTLADRQLKSSRRSGELLLGEIVACLS